MPDKIRFTIKDWEQKRQESNWREPRPGDVCWLLKKNPIGEEIDLDDLVLAVVSNHPTKNSDHFHVAILNEAHSLILVDVQNLCLGFTEEEGKDLKGK